MYVLSGSALFLAIILTYTNEVFVLFSSFGEMHLGMLLSLGIKQALNCFTAQSAHPSVPRGVRQRQGPLYPLAETLGQAWLCCTAAGGELLWGCCWLRAQVRLRLSPRSPVAWLWGCSGAKQETVWSLELASGEYGWGWAWGAQGDSAWTQLGPQ